MRDFARENNIDFWEGKGVCHQIMIENYVRPGQLIFGADSHTCSYGALGAFGTGVGCTDFLYGMVTGTSWVMVPETVKFNLTGKLPEGVYARDLILTIIGEIGANGCNYQAMEFTGEGARTLSISDRMALCNMAVEAGAKTGIFEAEEKAIETIKEAVRGIRNIRTEMNVAPSRKASVYVVSENDEIRKIFEEGKLFFASLAYANEIMIQADKTGIADDAVSVVIPGATLYIPFAELVDIAQEIERLKKEQKRLEGELARSKGMLSNERFLSKAPEAKIAEEKEKLAKYEQMMEQVTKRLEQLA